MGSTKSPCLEKQLLFNFSGLLFLDRQLVQLTGIHKMKSMFRKVLSILFIFYMVSGHAQSKMYSFQSNKMGTEFNIKVYGDNATKMNKAVDHAWKKIDSLNDIFSDYSHTSELAGLHQDTSGKLRMVSPDFACLMDISLKYSKLSMGAFDVSVGALTKIWRRAVKLNEFPDSMKIREALRYVGYKKIIFKKNKLKLPKGMRLDFGAIAKGYAVDAAYNILKASGYPISLVDGGGDIFCGASPPGRKGWEIATTIRESNGNWKDSTVYVNNASIVTSGDAYKYIEGPAGLRYSHIINPTTGYGISGPHLTTVIAENATHADALATTLSVLGNDHVFSFQKRWAKMFRNVKKDWQYWIYPGNK
jgi:thiamine biosynthesis lipoprotein